MLRASVLVWSLLVYPAYADSIPPDLSGYMTPAGTAASVAQNAPVKTVNQTAPVAGNVTVPSFERKTGTLAFSAFTTTGGVTTATWIYGSDGTNFVFSTPPKCFASIHTASTTVTYTFPTGPAPSVSSVTFSFRVQPVSISVLSLGSVSLTAPLPGDTSMDIFCLNPI